MHGEFKGINRKVQMKPLSFCATRGGGEVVTEALLILKWGGVLTQSGRNQAEELGRRFRHDMYPGTDGLLRLHSTYRHDLKIYSSDEGRVQVTAAAFAKGLLDLDGHLTPILASLVRKNANVNSLLDDSAGASKHLAMVKARLKKLLGRDKDLNFDDMRIMAPTGGKSFTESLRKKRIRLR